MAKTFSPKQVARALSVSESSLKRWCDQGLIATVRTAGGHRRVSLPAVMTFVRQGRQSLVHPELLGLPTVNGTGERVVGKTLTHFVQFLANGDLAGCRQVIADLYLAGCPLVEICDKVVAEAMHQVGSQWECGDLDVYQERVACGICRQVLDDCRAYLPEPAADASLAIGGTCSGDLYTLATQMAELVLVETGWRAQSLGSNLPFSSFLAAIKTKRPKLLWISVSYAANVEAFVADYQAFQRELPVELPVILGGQVLTESVRRQLKFFACCDNFQQLRQLAATLAVSCRTR